MGAGGLRGRLGPGRACGASRPGATTRPRRAVGPRAGRRRRGHPSTSCCRHRPGSPCGAPRPTTTGSAGCGRPWADWGLADLTSDRVQRRARDGGDDRPERGARRGPGSSSGTSSGCVRCADGGNPRRGDRRDPGRARPTWPRVGTVLEAVAGLEQLEWFGTGPHETYPDRKRGRARRPLAVDRHGPVRAVHPAPGERRPRRRPLARAPRRQRPGLRIVLDQPRQVSVTHFRAADLAAATHDVELMPRPETIVHLDAAHRGLGHRQLRARTRCRSTSSGRARTAGRGRSEPLGERLTVPIEWDRRRRASSTSATSTSATSSASTTTARSATSTSGRRWPPGARTGTSCPTPFHGFANRARRPGRRSNTRRPGTGDYPGPGARGRAARTARPSSSSRYREHRIAGRQAGDRPGCRPPTSRPTTRPTPSRSTSSTSRAARPSTLVYTIFRDLPIVARSARIRNGGSGALRLRRAMSASLDLPDADWDARPPERHVGARAPRPDERRLELGRQSVSSARGASSRPAQPVRRAPPADDDRGARRGDRPQPSSTRATSSPRSRSSRSGRPGSGIGIDPETFALDARAGRGVRDAGGGPRLLAAGLGALSDAFHRLFRERLARGTWRDRPRPVLAQQLGGDVLRLRRGPARSRSRRSPATSGSSCSCSTTAGSGRATTTRPRSATGSSTGASCPTASTGWPDGSRRSASGSACGSSPRWSASESQPVRARTRTGRSASPAGRGPRAASSSSSTCRRPEVVDHLFGVLSDVLGSAPDLVRQVGHEPEHHRAVRASRCRRTARASSSTATSSASTSCTGG